MGLLLQNPYVDSGVEWLKGNLHVHTSESDGVRSPQEAVDDYAARGYGFLALTDHDRLTDTRALNSHGMVLLPGHEISAEGPHILHVGARMFLPAVADRQRVLAAIAEQNAISIVCHPNWEEDFGHCPQSELARWHDYTGLEIYNGAIRRMPGSPLATDRWDMLLAGGRRVWGFGNDDCHLPDDCGLAWNMIQCGDRTVEAVAAALTVGSFYVSTGVTIERIAVRGRTLHVAAPDAERIAVVSDYGRREACADAQSITFNVPDNAAYSYVRVECFGRGEDMAWTQPFFLQR